VLLVALAGWVVLAFTPLSAMLANRDWDATARSSGPQVRPGLIPIYAIAGLLAAAAGLITIGRLQVADPLSGSYTLITAISAAVIAGAGLLRNGPFSLPRAALGALLVSALVNELDLAGVSFLWQQVAMGAVILCALLIDGIAQCFVDAPWL
jgi:ribose/xylose/arabinose/galactoside ABC-type transport system permease subunit